MSNASDYCVGLALGTLLGFFLGFTVAAWLFGGDARRAHESAIKAGVAEYVCDPATGVTTFEWKTPK